MKAILINNLLTQSGAIFVLVIIGYIIRKKELIRERETSGLTNIVIFISMPATIISSMSIELSESRLFFTSMTVLISVLMYLLKYLIGIGFIKLFRIPENEWAVHKLMILVSNCGFMGIPIAGAIFGEEGVFYTAIVNVCFNIVTWTLGIRIISSSKNQGYKINFKKLLTNPGILGVAIGFIVFLTQIDIPEFLDIPLKVVAGTTTPLAMFSIGSFLTETNIKSVIEDKKLFVSSFLRLIVSPLIMIVLVTLFKLPYLVGGTLVLLEAMPVATTTAIFAKQFNSEYELASKGIFLSTILSLVTVPLIMIIFSSISNLNM